VRDRRRTKRTTKDRRNHQERTAGVWTEAERARFIAAFREERRDARAVTIQGGVTVNTSDQRAAAKKR
jgi:hypothetical protein